MASSKNAEPILPVYFDHHTPSPLSSSDSLPPGTDSYAYLQRTTNKTDFEKFVEEAAQKADSKRAKWQIEIPPMPTNPSISTPVFQQRTKKIKVFQVVSSALFVAAMTSTITGVVLLIQDARHFGPRGWHVILLILSAGASFVCATIFVLIKWHQEDLQRLRDDFVLEKTVAEAADKARSEKGLAMLEVISTSDRQATQSLNEAASKVRALSERSIMLEQTIEALAFRVAKLSEKRNLDEDPELGLVKSKDGEGQSELEMGDQLLRS